MITDAFDVVYPTKVRIFQQITTAWYMRYQINMMLFTLQRYEFFSKSQQGQKVGFTVKDVVYPTKVRIFQQITTRVWISSWQESMLFTLQRYEFFSKSQRVWNNFVKYHRCCLPYKGTNFSANHNHFFTGHLFALMLFTLQRYEFFSKSQLALFSLRER